MKPQIQPLDFISEISDRIEDITENDSTCSYINRHSQYVHIEDYFLKNGARVSFEFNNSEMRYDYCIVKIENPVIKKIMKITFAVKPIKNGCQLYWCNIHAYDYSSYHDVNLKYYDTVCFTSRNGYLSCEVIVDSDGRILKENFELPKEERFKKANSRYVSLDYSDQANTNMKLTTDSREDFVDSNRVPEIYEEINSYLKVVSDYLNLLIYPPNKDLDKNEIVKLMNVPNDNGNNYF